MRVPVFWQPTVAGVRRLTPCGGTGTASRRLRDKQEVLYASPEFAWVLFGRRTYGKEEYWTPAREPRYMFRKLIERTMPGYFDVLGYKYGVDNLLAEFHQHLDLAFLAAMELLLAVHTCGRVKVLPPRFTGVAPAG